MARVSLEDKNEPVSCRLNLSGGGTLGTGNGSAEFTITEIGPNLSFLHYVCSGEIGGLVAGVGQRVLAFVAKHLAQQFFKNLRKPYAELQTGNSNPCRLVTL